MDKKTEKRLKTGRPQPGAVAANTAALRVSAQQQNWWMYHGDPAHTGFVSNSQITSRNVAASLKTLFTLQLDGPVLSVPAIVDGFIYVGTANSREAIAQNGGLFYKINVETGQVVNKYTWSIAAEERDTHSFCGMGSTPAISNGKVVFSALDGKIYCLDQNTLTEVWVVNLRQADPAHNQPITNVAGVDEGFPQAAGWSSPVIAGDRVYVTIGEGENPLLYSFVFCLDLNTGNLIWVFCTCQFEEGRDNNANELPAEVVKGALPPGFTTYDGQPVVKGCSVWASIAYDDDLKRLYCATGNPQPDSVLPSAGYSNGLLSLDAETGRKNRFFQVLPESNYRTSDADVDIGGSPTILTLSGTGIKAVGIGCKNGGYFILDADTLQLLSWRQLLPYYNNGTQIPTVDPHVNSAEFSVRVTNAESNATIAENYSGTFGTGAFYPGPAQDTYPSSQRLFIGIGGPNYHSASPGIDYETTPFMRAIDPNSLADAWPLDDNDPQRYLNARPPMYANAGECGLSSPAVVNDVVFCTTSKVSIYAFRVDDGTFLWGDDLGEQTGGYNGGYGYCMGPAVWGNYVVAGGLVFGRDGGVLRIYGIQDTGGSDSSSQ